MEGKEWVWEGSILRERKAQEIKNQVEELSRQRALDEHKLNLFNDFLSSLYKGVVSNPNLVVAPTKVKG